MADTSTTKLGELTKKFKAVNKEVITKLADYGEHVKSSTSNISEEQAALVVDILTQGTQFTLQEVDEMRADANKAVAAKAEEEA
ncbi:MAG: translation initiation factor IF-2 N-terminal domain-containing protein, partial [Candidatus Ornithomonoglobus sp.]